MNTLPTLFPDRLDIRESPSHLDPVDRWTLQSLNAPGLDSPPAQTMWARTEVDPINRGT